MNNLKVTSKKGEMTTQQIVTIIILVLSFSVILFLLFRLNLGDTTNEEICHNSVLLQESALKGGLVDCRTSYLCISGEEDCVDFNYDKKIDVKNKNEAMGIIADEMAKCWWMFGEGEVDYLGEDLKGYHCAICSIVKLSSDVEEISYEELYNYMEINKTETEGPSYSEYLYKMSEADSLTPEGSILSGEKYSIVTGLNPNWPTKDSIIYPMFVKSDEIKEKTECDVFDITKA